MGYCKATVRAVKAAVVDDVLSDFDRVQRDMCATCVNFAVDLQPQRHEAARLRKQPHMKSVADALVNRLKKSAVDLYNLCDRQTEEFERSALAKIAALQDK